MNRNYRVRVGSDDVVLRFYDRDRRSCAKETALLAALHGKLAVPQVLYVVPNAEPAPFAVLEFIDGIPMRELKNTGDRAGLGQASYDVGQQLATLSTITLRDMDVLTADPIVDPSLLAGSNVNARLIDHFLDAPALRARLSALHVERVRSFAWRRDALLASHSSTGHIAHGDFNSANILVRRQADVWRVAAILDWEFAFAGNLYYDVGNFLRYERTSNPRFEPSFSRGLADGGVSLPNDWLTVARLADLGALCELLTRRDVPDNVVDEVRALVLATLDDHDNPRNEA